MTRKALEKHLVQGKSFLLKRKPATFDASPEVEKLKREIQAWNSEALNLLNKTSGAKAAASDFARLGRMKYETLISVKAQLRERRKVIERFLNVASRKSPKTPKAPGRPQSIPSTTSSTAKRSSKYQYDVCFSFAGEDRQHVEQLYQALTARGVEVFYDFNDDIAVELWGRDLYTYLDDIYQNRAEFCIMFLSKHYVLKAWANHERTSGAGTGFFEQPGIHSAATLG